MARENLLVRRTLGDDGNVQLLLPALLRVAWYRDPREVLYTILGGLGAAGRHLARFFVCLPHRSTLSNSTAPPEAYDNVVHDAPRYNMHMAHATQ